MPDVSAFFGRVGWVCSEQVVSVHPLVKPSAAIMLNAETFPSGEESPEVSLSSALATNCGRHLGRNAWAVRFVSRAGPF